MLAVLQRMRGGRQGVGKLALEFEEQPFGGFLADAGYLGQAAGLLAGQFRIGRRPGRGGFMRVVVASPISSREG